MLCGSEAASHRPPPSLPAVGAQGLLRGDRLGNTNFACCCAGEQDEVEIASPDQGPAQIREKPTDQKSGLLFITVYVHSDESVQSFKERRAVRDMKCGAGVANDTRLFRQWLLGCRDTTLSLLSSFLQGAEKNVDL